MRRSPLQWIVLGTFIGVAAFGALVGLGLGGIGYKNYPPDRCQNAGWDLEPPENPTHVREEWIPPTIVCSFPNAGDIRRVNWAVVIGVPAFLGYVWGSKALLKRLNDRMREGSGGSGGEGPNAQP